MFKQIKIALLSLALLIITIPASVSAEAICYSGEGDALGVVTCGASGGSTTSSRTYKDAAGNTIDGPVDGKCYLSSGGSSHVTYHEVSNCDELAAEASANAGDLDGTNRLSSDCNTLEDCKIIGYLRDFINLLSAVAGIIIVIMIAYSGVRFSMSRDNAQEVAQWKNRILQALIALVFYLFTFILLQWLVPGGIF